MGENIRVEEGCAPWQPSEGAVLVKTLQRVSMPVVGIVDQDSVKFVFWRAQQLSAGDYSLWLYAYVQEDEIEQLSSAAGAEQLGGALREVTEAHVCGLADERGSAPRIFVHATFEDGVRFGASTLPALNALLMRMEDMEDARESLREVAGAV